MMAKKKKKVSKARTKEGSGPGKCNPTSSYSKYLFLLFFLAILVLAFLVVRPFLSTIIVSAILAYVFYPVYRYFHKKTGRKGFSAAVLIFLLIMVSVVPLVLVTSKLTKESYDVYLKAKQVFLDSDSIAVACAEDSSGVICGSYNFFTALSDRYDLNLGFHLARSFSGLASGVVSSASDFILNIPSFLFHIFVALFAMYYMLTQGNELAGYLKSSLPMRIEHSDEVARHFNDIIYATIYGAIVIAIFQGVIAGIGYFIFGVSSPLILGLLSIVASFIPFVGVALVWVPVGITMAINGVVTGNNDLLMRAGGLALYCLLIVSTIDNFLRPKIVGDRARVHPLVILLGVFGGLTLFGFVGVMIGPLILTLFTAVLKIYQQEKIHFL